ncbi:MAG: NUDIX hydrolase [Ignavibacteriales bacterium]|nr:NUDIX hydrolase [Ignavibacteriales bacterium]MBI3788108.1 NUDIX hydrolase [Ignavibacteriales bacterium]
MPNLKILKSEQRYAGKVFNLIIDEVEYPSGNKGVREVAQHPGGAVAVPLLDDGTIVLVRQFRYPMKQYLYELPAGKLNIGEDPKLCAARELEEETGYIAGSLKKLTSIYTTPGFCNEQLHIFLATELHQSPHGQRLEEGELDLTIEKIPFQQAVAMIGREEIVDSKTICGILLTEKMIQKMER